MLFFSIGEESVLDVEATINTSVFCLSKNVLCADIRVLKETPFQLNTGLGGS